jgi:hypothetical protein
MWAHSAFRDFRLFGSCAAHLVGAAAGSGGEGHESEVSAKRTESTQLSDTGSHNGAGDDMDEGSHTQSYYFVP